MVYFGHQEISGRQALVVKIDAKGIRQIQFAGNQLNLKTL